ncbi:MAG: SRPBCC family protein [Micavibrio sp.]|nr:SRPBCC family protein [Micavibrio sp.]
MFIDVILVLALLIVAVIIFVATRPDDFRISRSATIAAPPAAVFAEVNDFHKWNAWSPWAKMDPACKNTFDGADAGAGAIFAWAGNSKVGEGRMTILESRAAELIRIRLEFFKPFKATNAAEFTFIPAADGTTVSWTMTGTNGFMGKLIGTLMNCDKMVGKQFAEGLAAIKTIVETPAVGAHRG